MVLLLLVSTPLLFASSVRRIHDASFATPYAVIPVFIYCLTVFAITYVNHNISWLFLLLAFLISIITATISHANIRNNHQYVMGYSGPVNSISSSNSQSQEPVYQQRVEPTLFASQNQFADQNLVTAQSQSLEKQIEHNNGTAHHLSSEYSENVQDGNWNNGLVRWFFANQLVSIIALSATFVFIFILAIISISNDKEPSQEKPINTSQMNEQRSHKVEMPDGFFLMLDQNEALTIGWQGSTNSRENVWSAITGKGDLDCFEVMFSQRDKYRTMQVSVKNKNEYYADFSPIDTPKLISSIALKNRFQLCGYEFMLKGTQGKLKESKKYSAYISNKLLLN